METVAGLGLMAGPALGGVLYAVSTSQVCIKLLDVMAPLSFTSTMIHFWFLLSK